MVKCRHTEPDDLPEFLCRQCHPELNGKPKAKDTPKPETEENW